jgi:hypothetical protein
MRRQQSVNVSRRKETQSGSELIVRTRTALEWNKATRTGVSAGLSTGQKIISDNFVGEKGESSKVADNRKGSKLSCCFNTATPTRIERHCSSTGVLVFL